MSIQGYSSGVNFNSQAASNPSSPACSTISKTPVSQSKFFHSSQSDTSEGDSCSGSASPSSSSASPFSSPVRSSVSKFPNILKKLSNTLFSGDPDASQKSRSWTTKNSPNYDKNSSAFIFEGDSEGDSYDSDECGSPKQCTSPISSFSNSLSELSLGDSLISKEKQIVLGAIEKLQSLTEPSIKKEKVKDVFKKFLKKLSDGASTPDMRSPTMQRRVHTNLVDSPWAPKLVNECRIELSKSLSGERTLSENNLLLPVVNLKHIVDGEDKNNKIVGCHFCPKGSPLRKSLVNVLLNPANGIFCGEIVKAEGREPKFSSFYPDSIKTQAELLDLIHTAKAVMTEKNRSLRQTDKGFMIEVYLKENGLVIHSAFPIFFYGEYKKGGMYTLTENIFFKSEEVFEMAESLIRSQVKTDNENPIRYDNTINMVVDIAPALEKKTGIKSGVFISFPSSAFTKLD